MFVFGEIKLAKNIAVPTDECRRRTAKKYKRKIKKPRKQNRYMMRDKELNVEKLKITQGKKEKWKCYPRTASILPYCRLNITSIWVKPPFYGYN